MCKGDGTATSPVRRWLVKTSSAATMLALAALALLPGCQTQRVTKEARVFIEMLESSDVEKRRAAARSLQLRRTGPDLQEVLPALIRSLGDVDSEVRYYSLIAIKEQTGIDDFPGDVEEAWEYFKKNKKAMFSTTEVPPAERLRQTQAEIKNARGLQHMLMGEHFAAQNYFAEALGLDFDNPSYHNNLGLAYFNQGRLSDALGKFEDAMALDKTHAAAIMNAGRAYEKLGELEEGEKAQALHAKAEQFLRRAIRRDRKKTNWAARHVLARVYFKQNKLDEAIQTMKVAIEISPDRPELRATYAVVFYGAEMYYSAWKQLVVVKKLGARPSPPFVEKVKERLKETGQAESLDLTVLDFPEDKK